MATYLEQVRSAFPDLTKKGYSDEEVVLWLADKNGADPQEVGELLGVYDPDQGDFSRGISSGVDSTQAMAFGAGAWLRTLLVQMTLGTNYCVAIRKTWPRFSYGPDQQIHTKVLTA